MRMRGVGKVVTPMDINFECNSVLKIMFVKINQLLYIYIMLLFLRQEMYNTKKAIIIVAFYNQSNWEAATVYIPSLDCHSSSIICYVVYCQKSWSIQ